MNRTTLAVLLLLAAALSVLVVRELRRPEDSPLPQALVPGLRAETVVGLRLDHLERNTQLALERTPAGWRIVDPLDARADQALVRDLLAAIAAGEGIAVPAARPEDVGLAPPRAVLDVHWNSVADDSAQRARIEIGALDFDQRSLFVRVGGRIRRTLSTLDTILAHTVSEFRDPLLLAVDPASVVEIQRTALEDFGNERFGMALSAFLDNDGWSAVVPQRAALHPGPAELLIGNVARLRAERWLAGSGGDLDPARFGLDRPLLQLELAAIDGTRTAVALARGEEGTWYARCDSGDGAIAVVEEEVAMRLTVPFELLLDRRLLRAPLALLERVELREATEEPSLELVRAPTGWQVITAGGAAEVDEVLVRDLLGTIERTVFLDAVAAPRWTPAEVRGDFRFFAGDEQWRIEIGAAATVETAPGGALQDGVRVRRAGEEAVFLAEARILELLATRPGDLASLDLARVDELRVQRLEVRLTDGTSRAWVRSAQGRWTRAEDPDGAEAFAILGLLDALLVVRGERLLPAQDVAPAEEELAVRFVLGSADGTGEEDVRYELWSDPRGGTLVRRGERVAALPAHRDGLAADLARIVRAR